MARGPWKKTLWWDEKLSNGKSPKQIVHLITKDFGLNERDVLQILTRYLTLKEKKFFKRGARTADGIIVTTYLCCSYYMLGTDPINPRHFLRICKKNKFKISYGLLTKNVRKAKLARLFPRGPDCPKLIKKYRNRMAYKFHFEDEMLDELQELANKEGMISKIGGKNPFVAAAGLTYVVVRRHNLLTSQKQLADFFGISDLSVRNFWYPFREEMKFKQNIS